ncbi:MAG: ATP synthase F1 subunit epsilon [Planctomycetota bacterium]
MAELQLIVVTPEETALDQSCEFISLPIYDGEAGVLPGHAPMIGRLGPGELRVRAGGKDSSYYVDGGFVQIESNVVSVMTGRATPAAQLDLAAARQALEEANGKPGETLELMELKRKAVDQATAMIRLAQKAK